MGRGLTTAGSCQVSSRSPEKKVNQMSIVTDLFIQLVLTLKHKKAESKVINELPTVSHPLFWMKQDTNNSNRVSDMSDHCVHSARTACGLTPYCILTFE